MLPQWSEIRQAALDILRPDEKSLKHGLELHRENFIFDAYGFAPSGGGKCPAVDELLDSGASRDEIILATEQFRMCGSFDDPEMRRLLKEAWDFSGVDCNFQNSGTEGNDAVSK